MAALSPVVPMLTTRMRQLLYHAVGEMSLADVLSEKRSFETIQHDDVSPMSFDAQTTRMQRYQMV
jgi:hypothetical protein